MNDIPDLRTILNNIEQRLNLFLSLLEEKLDDLICKDEVNQLWKGGIESAMHTMWTKICSQSGRVSASCQTVEEFEHKCDISQESFSDFCENSTILHEEENLLIFCSEEDNATSNKELCDNTSRELSTQFARFIDTDSSTLEEENCVVMNAEEDNPSTCNSQEQCDVEVTISGIPSAHDNEPSASVVLNTPQRLRLISTIAYSQHSPEDWMSYSCIHCDAKFPRKSELSLHEQCHRKFQCQVCSRVFTKLSYFTNHRLYHTGRFPFECVKCGKSYATKKQLQRHKFYHKEPQYQCLLCAKAFHYPKQLTSHMATHNKSKPFVCPFCQKCYSTQCALDSHIRVRHPTSDVL